ncbi:hypothetical protein ACRAWD_30830 [Caulobacter segnis]
MVRLLVASTASWSATPRRAAMARTWTPLCRRSEGPQDRPPGRPGHRRRLEHRRLPRPMAPRPWC